MPFKRPGSSVYYIGPLCAGNVRVPRLSTGVKDLRTAKAIEAALPDLARSGWADLVQRVADKEIRPLDLYLAKLEGEAALASLRQDAEDEPLSSVIERARGQLRDERELSGLKQLESLAPKDARFSWLQKPTNITALYERALASGLRKNTVRRSLHRAVAGILTRELGRGKMLAIMDETIVPYENDERRVLLTVDEARKALLAADEEFQPVLGYAMTTGIDRGPMLEQRVFHYDEAVGTIVVPDRKAPDRYRTLSLRNEPILQNAEYWLRRLVDGKRPTDPLVSLTARAVRGRWEAIRAEIGRPDVRWKDLRGIFATYYLLAGGDPRELQAILGHAATAMTLRYLRRVPAGNKQSLRGHALSYGLLGDRGNISVVLGAGR